MQRQAGPLNDVVEKLDLIYDAAKRSAARLYDTLKPEQAVQKMWEGIKYLDRTRALPRLVMTAALLLGAGELNKQAFDSYTSRQSATDTSKSVKAASTRDYASGAKPAVWQQATQAKTKSKATGERAGKMPNRIDQLVAEMKIRYDNYPAKRLRLETARYSGERVGLEYVYCCNVICDLVDKLYSNESYQWRKQTAADLMGIMYAESRGTWQRGEQGEIGYMQLMPQTAKGYGVNPWNPVDNLKGGTMHYVAQLRQFGDRQKAIRAYRGPRHPGVHNPTIDPYYYFVSKIHSGSTLKQSQIMKKCIS
jgi:soluble lytic murein transglycosylase-like protein